MKVNVELCSGCASFEVCLQQFQELLALLNLEISLDTTLKSLPPNRHLHLVRQGEKSGTLEYTILMETGESYLTLRTDRAKPWVLEAADKIRVMWAELSVCDDSLVASS